MCVCFYVCVCVGVLKNSSFIDKSHIFAHHMLQSCTIYVAI